MNSMRVFFLLVIIISALVAPWWLFLCFVGMYTLFYTGYELLVVAALVDAFYGSHLMFPFLYTIGTGILCMVALSIKPSLRFYKGDI
jgi:hypothetical protein